LAWLVKATDKSLLLLFFRKEVFSSLFSFSPYLCSQKARSKELLQFFPGLVRGPWLLLGFAETGGPYAR